MTQINLNSPIILFTIKVIKYLLVAIVFHFAMEWFEGCSSEKTKSTQKVIIPEVFGKFEPKKPESKPLEIKQIPVTVIKKEGLVHKENSLNEKLLEENRSLKDKFKSVRDSIKLAMFEESNQINQFSSKFEDDNITLNINGIARGEVKEITPSYTIKRQKADVVVENKLPGLRVLGGVEVGNTKTLDNLSFKGSVLFQNRKGNIISAGYDTDNKIWLGYYKSIF